MFFLNDTVAPEIYTLSLHDALPISASFSGQRVDSARTRSQAARHASSPNPLPEKSTACGISPSTNANRCPDTEDRKSTRLNSSHEWISYAVFCLKKKRKQH